MYFSYYVITSELEAADEIMAKVQQQFQEVKVDFKTKNSPKKSYRLKNLC